MIKLQKLLPLIVAMFALLVGACSPEDPFIPTPIDKPVIRNAAYLRVIHAAADAPDVEVLVDDSLFFRESIGYLEFPTGVNEARYYPVDSASQGISFRTATGSLATAGLQLDKGAYYTAYLHGKTGSYKVLVTRDTLFPTPPASQTQIRAVNLSPDAPPFTLFIESDAKPPVLRDVASGTASQYVQTQAIPFTGEAGKLWVKRGDSTILFFTPTVYLPGSSVITLLITGNTFPKGEEPFLLLSSFQENARLATPRDTLYGSLPFNIKLAAVAFVNLVPTAPTHGIDNLKDSTLDVGFYDPTVAAYADNEYFRRNFTDQPLSMLNVKPLSYDNLGDVEVPHPHLFLSVDRTLQGKKGYYPYRIEVNTKDGDWIGPNPVLVPESRTAPGLDLTIEQGKRYTIVAFGPFERGSARSVVLKDNSPLPPAGMAGLRLFHGAYSDLEGKNLRLRVNGITGPAIGYGEIPQLDDVFSVPAGENIALELIDETGTVVHTQAGVSLASETAYTIFLSRGPDGKYLVLTPVSEGIRFRAAG